jgi:hypothetical protein
LPYCPRIQFVIISSLLTVCVVAYVQSLRHNREIQAQQQGRFGRYTAQEAIELARPILQAILPNKDNLFVTAEFDNARLSNGQLQSVWNVDCINSNGDYMVHVVRDATSGTICWVGYDTIGCSAVAHPLSLVPSTAAVEGQRWMRILGFTEKWDLIRMEKHRCLGVVPLTYAWILTLQEPGRRARLTIDERMGTLVYANILRTP